MITGDHPRTAASVAAATGVTAGDGPVEVITGRELDSLSPDALRDTVRRVDVFARVVPEHKVRIVEALKQNGEIAAMTGDGVNDVPALKAALTNRADDRRVVVVGQHHVDGERENLAGTPGHGDPDVGRAIHDNIVHFAHSLLAGNGTAAASEAAAVVLGLGAPLTVLQILLVNLLLDCGRNQPGGACSTARWRGVGQSA